MRFAEQTVIVTGGGGGIGQALCNRFATEGARVVVVDLIGERAQVVAQSITDDGGAAIALEADVSIATQVTETILSARNAFARIDVLVNNAASYEGDDPLAMDESTWDRDVDVSLKGPFLCSQAVLPHMIQQEHGVILNIASVNGLGAYRNEAYSAAKAGLINLTENLAVRYGPQGIRANAIAPGTIRTNAWTHRLEKNPSLFESLQGWYPLGRIGEPDDVARAACFLASNDAAWVTGVVLRVDGGLLAGNGPLAHLVTGC